MSDLLTRLRDAGLLEALDVRFAEAMGRLCGETRPEVLLAAALSSQRVRDGHVCLDLEEAAAAPLQAAPLQAAPLQAAPLHGADAGDAGDPLGPLPWPAADAWREALARSPLVADAGASDVLTGAEPLVLDGARLYLRRYFEHEREVARAIGERAGRAPEPREAALLEAALDRYFPPGDGADDRQREAARVASTRPFAIVTGGPGTGKTATVAKILALLVEQRFARAEAAPRILLLAPTGKAAARLHESIGRAIEGLPCEPRVRDAIPRAAATIHRALGATGDRRGRSGRDRAATLGADVVLVDEASMVDLALMARLLAALPERARLILLGDEDQLASVEAGAVLGDLCGRGAPEGSAEGERTVARGAARDGAADGAARGAAPSDGAADGAAITQCIVRLHRSYRYPEASGIGALARAIHTGDADAALDVLRSAAYPDVSLVTPRDPGSLGAELEAACVEGFRPYLEAAEPADAIRALDRFRVLCAHRRGPGGVEATNGLVERALRRAGLIDPRGAFFEGRPLLVTQNDYALDLFNGDVGLVARAAPGASPRAYFLSGEGALRSFSPARLPPHETTWAMSIHKSQGSELDEVAVLLPPRESPILTRELLYTAITRARLRVVIHASERLLRYAIARRVHRRSGLRTALWGRHGDAAPRSAQAAGGRRGGWWRGA